MSHVGKTTDREDGRRRTLIRTPDQRLRVFVSSTLQELAEERAAVREAVHALRLSPVMFELGARPHPPRDLYRAYLEQSHIFVGIYWQRYGWVAPGESVSGLEDEYRLSGERPKLIYIKMPAPEREPRLAALLRRIQEDDAASYKPFRDAAELRELLENDLALLLTERFEVAGPERPLSKERTNLPLPLTPLLGREREVRAVQDLLLREDVRLVTLSGPGGIGKTRLGLRVAEELLEHFKDGVYFVALAALGDPALVTTAIAQSLGVREGRSLLESLKDSLRDKDVLLLLDNFEHLLAAAPVVAALLSAAPRLKVLVTSRSLLRLSGEHAFVVPPLTLPDPGEPGQLDQYEAVRLFIERARAVKPSFAVTNENAPAVAEICHRLDGLPLAIELAAARIGLLSPQALLARLGSRLKLLVGGARDLPARQQALRATIDWSYNLLEADEQRLFARLSVFAGGGTLEAVEAVCGGPSLDALASLLDKNLLLEGPGEGRFGMLRTLQEYALEKLEASGEAQALRQAHAAHFLTRAEAAGPHLEGTEQATHLERLEAEHDNLRAALSWAAEHDPETGLRLAGALYRFWQVRGYLSEGREHLAAALRGTAGRTAARAKALNGAGLLAWYQGNYGQARSLLEEALAIWRELGDKSGTADALCNLGIVIHDQGDPLAARTLHQESLALHREVGDKVGVASTLNNLANIASDQRDYTRARTLHQESLALRRQLGDKRGVAMSLDNLGDVAYWQEDDATARRYYEEGLALSREVGDTYGAAYELAGLGRVATNLGDYASARRAHEQSLRLRRELGDQRGIADSLEGLAKLAAAEGRLQRAARLWGAAEALRGAIGAPHYGGERASYERDVALARSQDEAAFAGAWAEGRTMRLGRALDEALNT